MSKPRNSAGRNTHDINLESIPDSVRKALSKRSYIAPTMNFEGINTLKKNGHLGIMAYNFWLTE